MIGYPDRWACISAEAAATTAQVIVYTGSGLETINLGSATSPARDLLARFVIHNDLGGIQNQITINDSNNKKVTNFTVNNETVTTADGSLSVQLTGQAFGGGINDLILANFNTGASHNAGVNALANVGSITGALAIGGYAVYANWIMALPILTSSR